MQHSSEREFLKDIRKRKRNAWEAVISRNYKSIYRFMAYLTSEVSVAEDLTQETFASAWTNIDHFKGRASLRTWLHKVAYNKFVDSKRSRQRHAASIAGRGSEQRQMRENSDPLSRLMADECARLLYDAIRRLDSSEYIVIVLHYIQGLSFREMAKVLDEPVGTVKWRTSDALKRLKGFLTGRI